MSTNITTPNPNKKSKAKTKTAPPSLNDITKRQVETEGEHSYDSLEKNSYDSLETDVSEKEKSFITTTLVKTNIFLHKLSPSLILAKLRQKRANMGEGFQVIKRLLSYLYDQKIIMAFAYLSLMSTAMAQTKMPQVASAMIDSVILERSSSALNHVALQFLLVAILYSVSEYFWGHLFNILSAGIRRKLKHQVYSSLVRKEFEFYDKKSLNEVLFYLNNQIDIAQGMCTHRFSSFGRNFIQLAYSAWMLAFISYKLTLFLFLIVPVNLLLTFGYSKISSNILEKEKESFIRTNRKVTEAFQNIKIVKAYSTEETEALEYRELMRNDAKHSRHFSLAWSANVALTGFFANITLLSIVFIGMSLVNSGEVTPGTLSGFLIYSISVSVSFKDASFSYVRIKEAIPLCKELFNLIDTPSAIPYKGGKILDNFQGKIEFKDVAFSYPTAPEVMVLKRVSLTINPGDSVAFVGMSGGGKSTIISILLRFYDVAQGAVTFDDVDIKDLDLQWIHQKIGYVSQEPILFSGTIEENIAYGLENCSEERIIQALKMANAEFVFDQKLFPDGIKSDIGERGGRLSGGQKQRLAIARALAREPKVLIFDEATSNLDTNSEFEVQKAIDNLINDSKITIVTIAHRLSTILKCKVIYVIKSGEIIEKGSHQELVARGGAYKTLVERQLKALH